MVTLSCRRLLREEATTVQTNWTIEGLTRVTAYLIVQGDESGAPAYPVRYSMDTLRYDVIHLFSLALPKLIGVFWTFTFVSSGSRHSSRHHGASEASPDHQQFAPTLATRRAGL